MSRADSDRRDDLEQRLATVRAAVADACRDAGRRPDEVSIIAVTKGWPAADVRLLADLGLRSFGENRVPEALSKIGEVADSHLEWHFVGQLQGNKAGLVARDLTVIHSVDRANLVTRLERGAAQAQRGLGVCLQMDLSGESAVTGRGGCRPEEVGALAESVERSEHLRLLGVMAVAPRGVDPRGPFEELGQLHEELLEDHPAATWRCAGMSGDFQTAVALGATHIRLGSALLGQRMTLK